MSNDTWDRLVKLFADGLALPVEEREEFYRSSAGSDPVLRNELLSLHRARTRRTDALEPLRNRLLGGADRPSLEPGEEVGPYRLVREIPGGGMARIFQARELGDDRPVAIKFFQEAAPSSGSGRERFHREVRILARLNHPHVAPILDGGETDEKIPYFVMPWFDGSTLAKVAAQRRLEWREVLDFIAQAARGLGAAHEAGVIHRDVKPSNLMLTPEEELKIVDFGIARAEYEDTLTSSRVRLGTIAYMSPEQIRGDHLDARTDLWSLGVTTYELLASRRPFDAETPGRLLDQVVRAAPPDVRSFRPDLPDAVADFVAELLTGERDDRPSSASRVEAEMEALISS